jgi:MFS family permease
MATRVFHKGATEYGILGSFVAVGSLVGSLISARRRVSRQRLVIVSAIAFGVVETIAGLMPNYLTFALMLPLCGVTALTMITSANAFVQMASGPQMRGRVMALYLAIFMGGTPLGAPALGAIADSVGTRWTLIGGGVLTAIGTLIAVAIFGRMQGVHVAARWRTGLAVRVSTDAEAATDTVVAA